MKKLLKNFSMLLSKNQMAQIKGGYFQMGPCSTTCAYGDSLSRDCNPCGCISDNQPGTVGKCYCGVEGAIEPNSTVLCKVP